MNSTYTEYLYFVNQHNFDEKTVDIQTCTVKIQSRGLKLKGPYQWFLAHLLQITYILHLTIRKPCYCVL